MSSSAPGVPAQATNPHRTVRRAVGRHGRILAAPAGVDGPGRDGHDLPSGVAPAGSVLAGSLLTEYPAAAGGDCSAVPDRPAGTEGHDVAVVDPDVLSTLDPAVTNLDLAMATGDHAVAVAP